MKTMKKTKRLRLIAIALLLSAGALVGLTRICLPDKICLMESSALPEYISVGVRLIKPDAAPVFSQRSPLCNTKKVTASLLGVLPLKEISVKTITEKKVLPGGILFGVKLATKAPLIIELSPRAGQECPAAQAGLRSGDMITAVGQTKIKDIAALQEAINASDGNAIEITYERDGAEHKTSLTPQKNPNDAQYHAGILVRDSTAGIGTVTFIEPGSGSFAGLGHGICDADTGLLLPIGTAQTRVVELQGVEKGSVGAPGELRGTFTQKRSGALLRNTDCGVFGVFGKEITCDEEDLVPIGLRSDVHTGKATVLASVAPQKSRAEYEIEITKISGGDDNKSFIVHVTDSALLEQTGGIVQGMSGSPILQDGKLIGAITHVMVNDPTRGYGVFLENMLAKAS